MSKQIEVNGKKYQVRYITKKADGSEWYVCMTDELMGDFGDEYPVNA